MYASCYKTNIRSHLTYEKDFTTSRIATQNSSLLLNYKKTKKKKQHIFSCMDMSL